MKLLALVPYVPRKYGFGGSDLEPLGLPKGREGTGLCWVQGGGINGDTDTQTGRVTFPGTRGSQSPGQSNTEGCAPPGSHLFSLKIPAPLLSFLLVWQLLMGSNEFVYLCSLDIYSTNCIPRDIPPSIPAI